MGALKLLGILILVGFIIVAGIGIFGYGGGAVRDWYVVTFINPTASRPIVNEQTGENELKFNVVPNLILEGTNAIRVNENRPTLKYHTGLGSLAVAHSEDMVNRNYLSIETPEGESPQQQMAKITRNHWGCLTMPRQFVDKFELTNTGNVNEEYLLQWLKDYIEKNREDIMSQNINTGIGVIQDKQEGYGYVTQIVCTA